MGQLHRQEYKATKKQVVKLQLNHDPSTSFRCKRKAKKRFLVFLKISLGTRLASAKLKEVSRKPDKINKLKLKTKADMKERPDNIKSHPLVMFSFNCLVIICRGRASVYLRLDVQGQGSGRILNVAAQGVGGSWKLDNCHGCHMCIVPDSATVKWAEYIFWFISFIRRM